MTRSPSDMRQQPPALEQLMGAYFHQGWYLDAADEWGVVDRFVAESPAMAAKVPAEIARVLATQVTEEAVEKYVADLGCEYWADPQEGGYRGWLTEVASRVSAATRGGGPNGS